MSDLKLKACPIPGCGGEADATYPIDDNVSWVGCSSADCLLHGAPMPIPAWQALPRASEAVLEVEVEMREAVRRYQDVGFWPAGPDALPAIEGWADRLSSAAPGMGTPGEVWVGKCTHNKTRVELFHDEPTLAKWIDEDPERRYSYRLPVHGTPQPKAEAGSFGMRWWR